MKSKEDIEKKIRDTIESMNYYQSGKSYTIKEPGEKEARVKIEYVTEILDAQNLKDSLSNNFDETVRLTIIRELRLLLTILKNVKDIERIPKINDEGIGNYCEFTLKDIKELNLDDPEFIHKNFEEILQNLYESYGYEDRLKTEKEIEDLKVKCVDARIKNLPRSETLRMEKELKMTEIENGVGKFSVTTGFPLEFSWDCEKRIDKSIAEFEKKEGKNVEHTVTGEKLGKETLEEQENTNEKKEALSRLNRLRGEKGIVK